jgi:hypothetical protein
MNRLYAYFKNNMIWINVWIEKMGTLCKPPYFIASPFHHPLKLKEIFHGNL